ncbi:hypothetical protein [Algoriphagus taiwanensis]
MGIANVFFGRNAREGYLLSLKKLLPDGNQTNQAKREHQGQEYQPIPFVD